MLNSDKIEIFFLFEQIFFFKIYCPINKIYTAMTSIIVCLEKSAKIIHY